MKGVLYLLRDYQPLDQFNLMCPIGVSQKTYINSVLMDPSVRVHKHTHTYTYIRLHI